MTQSRTMPYFEKRATLDGIERIARQSHLLIYAGAGVSMDKTGLSWPRIVENLLRRRIEDDRLRSAIQTENPLQSASIVKQLYISAFGVAGSDRVLADDLRSFLYPEQISHRAELAHSLMRLAAELIDNGRSVRVVTTNYDDFLEQQLEEINALRVMRTQRPVEFRTETPDYRADLSTAGRVRRAAEKLIGDGRLLHLHGFVPQNPTIAASPVTFSEIDYSRAYLLSSEILEQLFSTHSVLILGSSLTDPPLLSSLARTAEVAERNKLVRMAIMPLQGLNIAKSKADLADAFEQNIERRMRHFNVSVSFPDYYSQVAQMVTETRICVNESAHGRKYQSGAASAKYGNRLAAWWRSWQAARTDDLEEGNRQDHEVLRRELNAIKRDHELDEILKLELWVRWDPVPDSRRLRLWASSTGTWPEADSMRDAEISEYSEFVSVRTFCEGRTRIHEMQPADDRWHIYLSVPVRVGIENGHDVTVAVISLASMDRTTKLSNLYAADVATIATRISELGYNLVNTQSRLSRD